MSLLPQLEWDLLAAARRRRRLRVRASIALGVVLAVLLAVPALAVTGAFKGTHKRDVISTLKGCGNTGHIKMQTPPPSTAPTSPEILRLLGAMRRPATSADRPPKDLADSVLAVNPAASRLVRTDPDGTRYYLSPTDDLGWQPALPSKSGCRVLQAQQNRNPRRGKPAVCLVTINRYERGGGCSSATQIEQGQTTRTGGSRGSGTAYWRISGIAPDGVVSVTATFAGGLTLALPVVGNVYAKSLVGSAGERMFAPAMFSPKRIQFHYADGRVREVGNPGPHGAELRRLKRQARLTAQRDREDGPVPAVFPPSGTPRTVFTLRARVAFPKERSRETYRITLRGPEPGDCSRELVYVTTSEPSLSRPGAPRPKVGLLKYGFGAYNISPGRTWCPGVYRGTVEFAPNGAKRFPRQLVGRFAFRIR